MLRSTKSHRISTSLDNYSINFLKTGETDRHKDGKAGKDKRNKEMQTKAKRQINIGRQTDIDRQTDTKTETERWSQRQRKIISYRHRDDGDGEKDKNTHEYTD
jgi:hypothetical protein